MGEAALRRPPGPADIAALPETLVGEIIDRVLVTHPRPRPRHAAAAFRLGGKLFDGFDDSPSDPGGWIFMAEPELHLGPHIVVPDLAGWRRERLPAEPETPFVAVAPDWVCEILSPSTARLDRGPKRRIYAEASVGHLWLLDPAAGELEAFAHVGGHWLLLATIQRGEEVAVAPFDAAPFPFDDLFPFDTPPAPEA